MAGINRPLLVITQDSSDTARRLHNQNEVGSPRGVNSDANFGIIQTAVPLPVTENGTAEVQNVNCGSSASLIQPYRSVPMLQLLIVITDTGLFN